MENVAKVTELEELKTNLSKSENLRQEANLKLDKAYLLLNNWVQEYYVSGPIDLYKAMDFFRGKDVSHENEKAAKWIWEANLIFGLIDIVQDYVYDAKELTQAKI